VHLGEDPWLGVGTKFRFLTPLFQTLRLQNIYTLNDAKAQSLQIRGRMGWKSTSSLGLIEVEVEEWNQFIGLLVSNFIVLDEEVLDALCLV
jgi:hypothetical protein